MCKQRDDKELEKGAENFIETIYNNKSFTQAPRVVNYSGAYDCITEDRNVIENLKILRNICLKRDNPVTDETKIYLDSERGKPQEDCGDKIFNDSNQFKLLVFKNNLEYSHEYMSRNESYELVYHHDYDFDIQEREFKNIIDKAYSDDVSLHHVFGDMAVGDFVESFLIRELKFPERIMNYKIPTRYDTITKNVRSTNTSHRIDEIKTKPYTDTPIIKNPYAMSQLPKGMCIFHQRILFLYIIIILLILVHHRLMKRLL